MSDLSDVIPYYESCAEAVHHYNASKFNKCIETAKMNLTVPNLPKLLHIKNNLLIAAALDNWVDAEPYRLAAEHAYETAHHEATVLDDGEGLEILKKVRDTLDEMIEDKEKDLARPVDQSGGARGPGDPLGTDPIGETGVFSKEGRGAAETDESSDEDESGAEDDCGDEDDFADDEEEEDAEGGDEGGDERQSPVSSSPPGEVMHPTQTWMLE